jgi:hypothetical protein
MDIFFASFFKSLSTVGSLNTDESACTSIVERFEDEIQLLQQAKQHTFGAD